jgi:hypothetical protein
VCDLGVLMKKDRLEGREEIRGEAEFEFQFQIFRKTHHPSIL